jgi:hypothetical protein
MAGNGQRLDGVQHVSAVDQRVFRLQQVGEPVELLEAGVGVVGCPHEPAIRPPGGSPGYRSSTAASAPPSSPRMEPICATEPGRRARSQTSTPTPMSSQASAT